MSFLGQTIIGSAKINYYIVNYNGDTKDQVYVVPKNWLSEIKTNFPFLALVFFDPQNLIVPKAPVHSHLFLLHDNKIMTKAAGRSYIAEVLKGFGK